MGVFISIIPPGLSYDVPAGYIDNLVDRGYKAIWDDLGFPRHVDLGAESRPVSAAQLGCMLQACVVAVLFRPAPCTER